MTPQEKANELVQEYVINMPLPFHIEDAKICALIAVDEILNNFGTLTEGKQHYAAYCTIKFYERVKKELKKL